MKYETINSNFNQNLIAFENFLRNIKDDEKNLKSGRGKEMYNDFLNDIRQIFKEIIGYECSSKYSSMLCSYPTRFSNK